MSMHDSTGRVGEDGERGELMPDSIEERAHEIAGKYIEKMPPGANLLTKSEEVGGIFACEREISSEKRTRPGGSAFSTRDKLGNLPGKLFSVLSEQGVTDDVLDYLASFANDPAAHMLQIDKVRRLENMPRSVRDVVVRMILCEGEGTVQEAYQEISKLLHDTPSQKGDPLNIFRALKVDSRFAGRDNDRIRARAVEIFLDTLYPVIGSDPVYRALRDLWDIDDTPDVEELEKIISHIVISFGDVSIPSTLYKEQEISRLRPKKLSELRDALNDSELISSGLGAVTGINVFDKLTRALEMYCTEHILRVQNRELLKGYSLELEKCTEALRHEWISEEKPRHRVGSIVSKLFLPLITSEELLPLNAFDHFSDRYQKIVELIPVESDDPHMEKRLADAIVGAQAFIATLIVALDKADTQHAP